MSNNPVQPAPIPMPPTPAEIQQTQQQAAAWLKQHEDVPKLLSRKHLSLGKMMALLFLLVTLPLTVFVAIQQQQLAEVRSKAAEATPAPTISAPTAAAMPERRFITSKARDYDRLMKTYFQGYVADPAQIQAKIWNVSVADKQIQGTIHLKYDAAINQTFVLARLTGLAVPKGKELVRVWVLKQGEYIPLGATDFEPEGEWRVAYSVFAKDGDWRDSDKIIVSYALSQDKQPQASKIIVEVP
jgi:hypothetical protein